MLKVCCWYCGKSIQSPIWLDYYEALPGQIPTSDMAQKVATERKMKSRQVTVTTSLGQIATVTAKARISDKERVVWLIYHQKK